MFKKLQNAIKERKIVIVPMDHGVSFGPIDGLENMKEVITNIKDSEADAIVIHKGVFLDCKDTIGNFSVFVHITASTNIGNSIEKVLVATAEEVKNMGGSGVSMHVNIGNKYEGKMIENLGKISRKCKKLGMPLLAMVFVKEEKNGKVVVKTDKNSVAHAARLAYELGADIVKVSYPGNVESFKYVVDNCAIPVIIDGGEKKNEDEMLETVSNAVSVGGAGTSIGRNIFQSSSIKNTIKKIKKIINNKK